MISLTHGLMINKLRPTVLQEMLDADKHGLSQLKFLQAQTKTIRVIQYAPQLTVSKTTHLVKTTRDITM